jgi:hypothetical protein
MAAKIKENGVYAVSEDVVAREVQGEFIIIPITSGIGDAEDEIFSLNDTGRAIWDELDGKKNLLEVARSLSSGFEGPVNKIKDDVLGLAAELLKRKMIIEVKRK